MAPAGLIFAIVESIILGEISQISHMESSNVGPCVAFYIAFAAINLIIYNFIPYFLSRAGATLMNIGNLTTSVWSMLFDIVLFNGQFKWFYLVGFAFQILAIVLFSLKDPLQKFPDGQNEGNHLNLSSKSSHGLNEFGDDKSTPLIDIDSDKVPLVVC